MITSAEFKKQIAKPFGEQMRKLGFKGTGFEYIRETEGFLYSVYIEPSRWGGTCSLGMAIHPKQINKNSGGSIDLKKLKVYDYEFKTSLSDEARGFWWEYSDNEQANLKIMDKNTGSGKNEGHADNRPF